jgi:hypothetical protein
MLKSYLSLSLLPLYLVKTVVLGVSLADSIPILGLTGLFCFFLFLESKREPIANKELKERLLSVEEQLKETKSNVNAIKIGNQFRMTK